MSDVPTNYRQLPGSELRPGPDSKFLGPAKDSETIKVTIVLRRRPDGPAIPTIPTIAIRRPLSGGVCRTRNLPASMAPTSPTLKRFRPSPHRTG